MKTRLTELISSLTVLNDTFENKKNLGEIISILNEMNKKNIRKNDNDIASYIVSIITLFPDLMRHPNNQALKNLCLQLKPDTLHLPPIIEQQFTSEKPHLTRRLGR